MESPNDRPNAPNLDDYRAQAKEFLGQHFTSAIQLDGGAVFARSPLHGEGVVAIFQFRASKDGGLDEKHYVAVGQTEPNYYPAYGLSLEEAFCLHLGTRFMLVMGVAAVNWSAGADSYGPVQNAREIVNRIAPDSRVENVEMAAMFDVDGELHAVLRADLNGRTHYVFGRDAPWGFSDRSDLPAPVAYRLHVGHVLQAEPDDQPLADAGHL